MKFNSQVCTTPEQSKRLLALGLKQETADMGLYWSELSNCYRGFTAYDVTQFDEDEIPAWSLHRLIVLCGNIACDWIFRNGDCYANAIKCIEWLIKEGHFNQKYLV